MLDARDAMPAGGAVCILTGTVALDAEYARTHPEVPPGDYAMLTIRDTGDGSNAASLKALRHKAAIRKGRSLGLAACYDVIDQLSGHLCVSRHAHETVIKIYLPCAEGKASTRLSSLRQRLAIFGWRLAHVPFEDAVEVRDRLKTDFENDLAHAGIWI